MSAPEAETPCRFRAAVMCFFSARLFAQNVRIYAYPMSSGDLRERLKGVSSAANWAWDETNGMVSATQLRPAPPVGHLFAYLLASNFLVPMQVPATLKADA